MLSNEDVIDTSVLLKNIGFSLIVAKRTIYSFTRKNADRKEDDMAIQTGIESFVQCIKNNAKTEEVDNITTAMRWLVNNKGMVGTALSITDNKTSAHGGSNGDDNLAQGDGGETANDGGHERKGADHKDDGDSDDSDEILQMSDGESEESDGFFGFDESTKENENDVEVPVGKEIDDNDPFFADADDHNEGEENEEGEGAIEGSNKPDKLFYSSGSDSDGVKDNETEGRKKDKDLLLTKQDISTTETKRKSDEQGTKKKKKKEKKTEMVLGFNCLL
jgi:hypothetical protein